METIDMARRLAELGQTEKACEGFELALRTQENLIPADKMEAALFVLQFGGDYKVAYRALLALNHQGEYREEAAAIMTEAFYEPNEKLLRSHYENNCRELKKYKYFFRKDFLPFEELPVRFFPFDDKTYIPCREGIFGEITDYGNQVVTRNFFHDLEKPILAKDVYSQYELEYLNDNVRPSEWVGRENHIYLHYTDWAEFCACLQVLNFHRLLEDKKLVFLIEEEIEQYPIDFKEKYGMDYSQFPLKPLGVREFHRLIWHSQLSYHNGGDFFNEVLDGHPNLLCTSSIMNETMETMYDDILETLKAARSSREIAEVFDQEDWGDSTMIQELFRLRDVTAKDILVAFLCRKKDYTHSLDPASRIVPAIMYQPHFGYNKTKLVGDAQGRSIMTSAQYDELAKSSLFQNFKYIKTFVPMRRITTSYGATIRFMADQPDRRPSGRVGLVNDQVLARVTFRGFLADKGRRPFKDCVVVRFEDAKLNPTAAFHALAEFLDIPYTESMKYCTYNGESMDGFYGEGSIAEAFNTEAVYRSYDDFATTGERCYIEYFLRDAYEYYGYGFNYYDGQPVDEARVWEWVKNFDVINSHMERTARLAYQDAANDARKNNADGEFELTVEQEVDLNTKAYMEEADERRMFVARLLMKGLSFVNENGDPLEFMPMLKLDPALMEQPLYH